MAKAKTHSSKPPVEDVEPETAEAPEPMVVPRVCGNCEGWSPLGNDPVLGECLPSRRARMAPWVTTDLQSCSRFKSRFGEAA